MSYYDPNYWRQFRRFQPYVWPIMPAYRPDDPITQLGLTRNEPAIYTICSFCGATFSAGFQQCPVCGWVRGF
ncbi:hypothetical protein KEJ39_08555 [Candidatus Bathyarchaeota archaeon]|nr:hypothetical protein [Candidatus Bathyarchaeota archaeon]